MSDRYYADLNPAYGARNEKRWIVIDRTTGRAVPRQTLPQYASPQFAKAAAGRLNIVQAELDAERKAMETPAPVDAAAFYSRDPAKAISEIKEDLYAELESIKSLPHGESYNLQHNERRNRIRGISAILDKIERSL